jgi:Zn-finger nucleic acid-binding protein
MTGPYREGPSFLICPRCGELLDRVFDDVLACMRCHGVLITPLTAGLAFEDPAWPKDASAMWWKSSLSCPVCAHAGADTVMAAQMIEGLQIDRCAAHGLWLDAGELSRLARASGDELAFLRTKLHGDGDGAIHLDQRREAWRRDVEARKRAAEEANARLAAERQRQIEEADRRQAELARAAEEERRIEVPRPPPKELFDPVPVKVEPPPEPVKLVTPPDPPRPKPPTPPPPPPRPKRSAAERDLRAEQRADVVREIGLLEGDLMEARRTVRTLESKLADQRVRLRALIDDD